MHLIERTTRWCTIKGSHRREELHGRGRVDHALDCCSFAEVSVRVSKPQGVERRGVAGAVQVGAPERPRARGREIERKGGLRVGSGHGRTVGSDITMWASALWFPNSAVAEAPTLPTSLSDLPCGRDLTSFLLSSSPACHPHRHLASTAFRTPLLAFTPDCPPLPSPPIHPPWLTCIAYTRPPSCK